MIEEFSKFSNATIKNRFIIREKFLKFFVSLFRGFINPLLNTRFQTNPLNSSWFFISRRFVALFPLCRVEPFQVSLFPLFTRHSSFMRLWAPTYSSLLAPPPLEQKTFQPMSLTAILRNYTFISTPSFVLTHFLQFLPIQYRYRIRKLFDMEDIWMGESRAFRVQRTNLYTYIHIHIHKYISCCYFIVTRFLLSTFPTFFSCCKPCVFTVILSWLLQAFHSRTLVSVRVFSG